jgi:hypothetical protein
LKEPEQKEHDMPKRKKFDFQKRQHIQSWLSGTPPPLTTATPGEGATKICSSIIRFVNSEQTTDPERTPVEIKTS